MRGRYDVCAIGGGPDALVAAAYLAASGRSVLVVGEQGQPGGIAASVEIAPGFAFSVAPETLPAPDPVVVRDLDLERHGLHLLEPDPVLTVFGDGEPFCLPRDPAGALSGEDRKRYPEFAAELRSLAGFHRKLIGRPPLQLDSSLPDALPTAFAALGLGGRRLNEALRTLPMALADYLDNWFESRPLKAALAGPTLTGIRLGPRAAGSAGLFQLFHGFGSAALLGWIRPPRGGAASVGRALREAARVAGAHLDSESGGVRRITAESSGRLAVELQDGRSVRCGAIVSDAAPGTTLLRWVGERNLSPDFAAEARHIRYRGTAARVGFALSARPRLVDSDAPEDARLDGILQIGGSLEALERAADAFKYREIAAEPLVLAALTPSEAKGATLAATVQSVPGDADESVVAERALARLECAFPGIREIVTASRVLVPGALERGFGLLEGSFHQGEPTLDQFYSLRPIPGFARYRAPVPGLYLAGPGTWPGGGLHGISGRGAAQAVMEDGR